MFVGKFPYLSWVFSDGTCVRDYIHVMDLAGGHLNALDALVNDSTFANCEDRARYKVSQGTRLWSFHCYKVLTNLFPPRT